MKTTPSRKAAQEDSWPRKVQPGREVVTVYRRTTPSGNYAFMVANYVDGKRRFDSYASEREALDAADALARRIDKRDYIAASLTKDQAAEYANSNERLKSFGVRVDDATTTVARCLRIVPDLGNIEAAVKFYAARHKQVTKKPVAEVVADFLAVKSGRGLGERYLDDLTGRLNRFAGDCKKDACHVTTADIQDWLDELKLSPQSYRNYRTVLQTLFNFAVAKAYAAENPVEGTERIKVRNGDVEIFKPLEIGRLLESARMNYPDYLPCLAIGAFAGLRSAEIERLEWGDINLPEKFIVVTAGNAKTASRRIVPIHDNLASWLAPYAGRQGRVWKESSVLFYKRQEAITAATAVEADEIKGIKAEKPVAWKSNGLRHSYASYRFAQTGDAGRVAGECGNSSAVIHKHYRQLTKPADAERWFNVYPREVENVVSLRVAQ